MKRCVTAVPLALYGAATRRASQRILPPISFAPEDHRAHGDCHAEWWYFTSVLSTPGRHAPLGVEVTFFRIRTLLTTVVVHVAVTDVEKGEYVGTGVLLPVYPRALRSTGPVLRFPGGEQEAIRSPKYSGLLAGEADIAAKDPRVRRLRYYSYFVTAVRTGDSILFRDPLREEGVIFYPPVHTRVAVPFFSSYPLNARYVCHIVLLLIVYYLLVKFNILFLR